MTLIKKGKTVTFGEVMLRLSTPGFQKFEQATALNVTYGGGDANVAISLAHFGLEAEHVTRFPDHDMGYAAASFLNKQGLSTKNIAYGGNRLGIYYLETGASVRPSKVVYDRAGSSFADCQPADFNWKEILKDATCLHFTGITPAISLGAAEAAIEAVKVAKELGVFVTIDVNYRKNLWQYGKKPQDIMPQLVACADLIFASKGDMEELFGVASDGESERFASVCKQMTQKFPNIKRIVNTKRGSISASHNTLSAVMWNGTEMIKTDTMEVNPIIDRIGGGDAFCAGLIYGLMTYNDELSALKFGLAASILKHTIEGDANLASVKDVELIMGGETSGKILR